MCVCVCVGGPEHEGVEMMDVMGMYLTSRAYTAGLLGPS